MTNQLWILGEDLTNIHSQQQPRKKPHQQPWIKLSDGCWGFFLSCVTWCCGDNYSCYTSGWWLWILVKQYWPSIQITIFLINIHHQEWWSLGMLVQEWLTGQRHQLNRQLLATGSTRCAQGADLLLLGGQGRCRSNSHQFGAAKGGSYPDIGA